MYGFPYHGPCNIISTLCSTSYILLDLESNKLFKLVTTGCNCTPAVLETLALASRAKRLSLIKLRYDLFIFIISFREASGCPLDGHDTGQPHKDPAEPGRRAVPESNH